MADRPAQTNHHQAAHSQHGKLSTQHGGGGGLSAGKMLGVAALLPIGGTLLLLSGLTFVGTLIGLAVITPAFVIFSPVLVPAMIAVGLAVTGFVASGACGATGLSALVWLVRKWAEDRRERKKEKAFEMA